jgi:Ca2+-binding RTX toxin-like protein
VCKGGAGGSSGGICFDYPIACGDPDGYVLVQGTFGNDDITPNSTPTILRGLCGDDDLHTGDSPDCILGGSGNDTIYNRSESGVDVFAGGDGNDVFYTDYGFAPSMMLIVDMGNGDDEIHLKTSVFGFGASSGPFTAAQFKIISDFSGSGATDSEVRVIFDPSDGELWSYNGEGGSTLFAQLLNDYVPDASDFVFD